MAEAQGKYSRTRWVALVLGAAMFVVSNGRWIVPAAAWLAPTLLLRFTREVRPVVAAIVIAVVVVGGAQLMLAGLVPGGLGALGILLKSLVALLWLTPYVLDLCLSRRLTGAMATLVFPSATVCVEYILSPMYGTWGSVCYTQFENLPLLQLAALTGCWGVTFVVAWSASVWAHCWARGDLRSERAVIQTWSVVLVGVLVGGGLRLLIHPSGRGTTLVALLAPGPAETERLKAELAATGSASLSQLAATNRLAAHRLARDFSRPLLSRTEELAARGAKLVCWPEGTLALPAELESELILETATCARASGAHILLGYATLPPEWPSGQTANRMTLVLPSGQVGWSYDKTHPVPGARHPPGTGTLPMVDTPIGRLTGAICYDMDFPELIAQAGRRRAELILAPSWDWPGITPLHGRMAVLRGIENGCALIRPTGDGWSVVSDALGRCVASMLHPSSSDPALMAAVSTERVPVVFPWIRGSFAWANVAGLLALIGQGVLRPVSPAASARSPGGPQQ